MVLQLIVKGVRDHLPARRSEWVIAAMMIGWGLSLLAPDNMFDQSPALRSLGNMFSENTWGAFAVTIGCIRLIALVINGTFWNTWYGRFSPHVRALSSIISMMIWAQIAISIATSGVNSTGIPVYMGLAFMDILNAFTAWHEGGAMDGRNGVV